MISPTAIIESIMSDQTIGDQTIACPFRDARIVNCDIVLSTSSGRYEDFQAGFGGLHVGICDDKGRVIEFTKDGLGYYDEPNRWENCLDLRVMERLLSSGVKTVEQGDRMKQIWLDTLQWSQEIFRERFRYDREHMNCLDFIHFFTMKLINRMQACNILQNGVSHDDAMIKDVSHFVEKFIMPRTIVAAKYLQQEKDKRSSSH